MTSAIVEEKQIILQPKPGRVTFCSDAVEWLQDNNNMPLIMGKCLTGKKLATSNSRTPIKLNSLQKNDGVIKANQKSLNVAGSLQHTAQG